MDLEHTRPEVAAQATHIHKAFALDLRLHCESTSPLLHLSHLSIAYSFVVVALETAMSHILCVCVCVCVCVFIFISQTA